jgi:hypothetical protein
MAASALLGAAVLCKLTAFYMPALALITLALFHAAAALGVGSATPAAAFSVFSGALLARWRAIAIDAVLTVGPYGLFFLYGSHSHFNTLRYIRMALSNTWTDGLPPLGRAAFYGPGQDPAWGPLAWLLASLILLSVVAAWRKRELRFLQPVIVGLAVCALFFAPLIVAKTSNIEFGGLFVGVVLGFALVMLIRLASLSRGAGAAALLAVLIASLFVSFQSYRRPFTAVEQADQAQAAQTYETLVRQIIALRAAPDVGLNVYYEDTLLPHPNLGLIYFDQTGRRLNTNRIDHMPHTAEEAGQAAGGDFSILLVPAAGTAVAGYMPSPGDYTTVHQLEVQAFVQKLPNMRRVATYSWKNGQVELYQRTPGPEPTP